MSHSSHSKCRAALTFHPSLGQSIQVILGFAAIGPQAAFAYSTAITSPA